MPRHAGGWSRALCVLLALISAGCRVSGPPAERPNIVLLISDDHGYPDHGFMGSPIVRTPRLDALAAEGVVFTHGYSTGSVCRPALSTLLTGLEPFQLRFWERQWARSQRRASGDRAQASFIATLETLPRLLGERGYASFQAGKHWEGPFRQAGFDAGMVDTDLRNGANEQWHPLLRETMQPVFDFLAQSADGPFFLWFAPLLPHLPHDAPERYRALYADVPKPEADYYAAISWLDDGIGQLVDRIRALDLERRTLFVYVADNGWDPGGEEWAGTLLGGPKGKMSLYELGFRTPVVLSWKGGIAPAPARDELVSLADVFATILDYAGAPLPPQRSGHSLRPLLEDGAAWPRHELVGWMERLRGQKGRPDRDQGGYFWRDARWHYLQPVGRPAQLFDLDADPGESSDVGADHPAVTARARERIEAWTHGLPLERARQ